MYTRIKQKHSTSHTAQPPNPANTIEASWVVALLSGWVGRQQGCGTEKFSP